eukprot:8070-Heterococcus_DN1.PRE.2
MAMLGVLPEVAAAMLPEWNTADSDLHRGVFTRYIDYSYPAKVTHTGDLGANSASQNQPRNKKHRTRTTALLASCTKGFTALPAATAAVAAVAAAAVSGDPFRIWTMSSRALTRRCTDASNVLAFDSTALAVGC